MSFHFVGVFDMFLKLIYVIILLQVRHFLIDYAIFNNKYPNLLQVTNEKTEISILALDQNQ